MIRLRVTGACAVAHTAAPTVAFTVRIDASANAHIHAVALQTLIRLEPGRRHHNQAEQRALFELFGEPSRWTQTLQPLFWAEVSRIVPAFQGSCEIELVVPCSYDLYIASSKYLHAIRGGPAPLQFLFRGTVFTEVESGFDVSMIPWDRQAAFDLPAETWRAAMDAYFPDQGWLRLHRDVIDSLIEFKAARALPSWDAVVRDLLASHTEVPS